MDVLSGIEDRKPALIYIGIDSWSSMHQRPQHLAACLSEYFRVLYVDPTCFSLLGYIRNHLRGDKSRVLRSDLQMIQQDLYLFRSAPILPISLKSQWATALVLDRLTRSLTKVIRHLDFRDPVLVLSWPLDLALAGKMGEALLCYDCMDNYAAFTPDDSKNVDLIATAEESLLRRADLVFASAKPIQTRIAKQHFHVHLVRNAVSKWFLSYQNVAESPADWPEGDGPVIGYVGMIAEWFDFDAIVQLATRNPDWRIVIIGPSAVDLSRFSAISNLYFLGRKPHSELPNYVSKFDIGLISFLINELTVDVNPVKLYEYFALGIPVVASRLPELLEYHELIYLAADTTEFVEQVERAVQDCATQTGRDAEVLRKARREVACQNTWEMRASSIEDIVHSYRREHTREAR